jgi:transposase
MLIVSNAKPLQIPSDTAEKDMLLVKQHTEIQTLTQQLAYLKRMIFGQKSERFVPSVPEEQMALDDLFATAGATIPGFAETKETISYERRTPKKGHGRNPIPQDLHREKHVIDVAETEKVCSCCGSEKKHIGDDITEELEYKPAVFFVNQYVRPKYACATCPDNGITTAPMPARPIDKGVAGPGLLAYILVSKYVDHLPLYRLEQMFKRYNIHINRSSMAGWIAQLCNPLEAICQSMKESLQSSFLIQADETTLKVLDDTVKNVSPGVKRSGGKCELGYLWPYVGDGKLAVFEFRNSRSREGPTNFLDGFTGTYLMSDGYAGYNEVVKKQGLTHLMCWAHARRKFFEQKDIDPVFVEQVLGLIKELYMVELEAANGNLTHQARCALRKQKSVAILERIKNVLENPNKVILPKNKIAEAIAYTLNHWVQLTRFLEDGRLPVDNNLCENTIRPVALGRKNWLFAGSPEGAKRMAIIYSLVATCKLNGINPYEYFRDILPKVAAYSNKNIADLTPVNWNIARCEKQGRMG